MKRKLFRWCGALAGAALLIEAASPFAFAAPAPSISVAAPSGTTPYSHLSVSGSGFSPGEVVQIYFGLSQASTTADAQGNFANVPLIVPNVSSGTYVILALGQTSGDIAFSYFFVGSFYPQASPSSWWTAPGSTVTFSGSGFAPNEGITITLSGSSTPFASFSADASGSFVNAGALTIPYSLAGKSGTVTVHAAQSSVSIPLTISVLQLYPWVNPSAWYIRPGNSVTFSGGGFGPGEGVNIYLGASTTPAATAVADRSGAFSSSTAVVIPYGTGVAHYRAVGDQSGASVNMPITRADFYPTLTPSVYYSAPNGTISLSGSGFAPNEIVNISLGTYATTSATADASGAFSIPSVQLPGAGGVQISITATGAESGATATVKMTMGQYYTWAVLSTYWAEGGTPLAVTGHNFAPDESVLLSTSHGQFASTTADKNGDFSSATTVPYAPPGDLEITATGATSETPASVHMTVAPVYTDIELGSYAGAPGSHIEFIGKGYVPNDVIDITTDRTGSSIVAAIQADKNGDFDDSSFVIPANWKEGNLTLTITGTKSFNTKSIVYYVTGS
ncbi:MAG: hypothetical protein ACREGH_04465 [Minisyncoccia bacterium]